MPFLKFPILPILRHAIGDRGVVSVLGERNLYHLIPYLLVGHWCLPPRISIRDYLVFFL